jgi:hypothetical protein
MVRAIGAKNNGYYVITEYFEHFIKNETLFMLLAETTAQKASLLQQQNDFFYSIKPIVQANTWTDLCTENVSVDFKIDGLYRKLEKYSKIKDEPLFIKTASQSNSQSILNKMTKKNLT